MQQGEPFFAHEFDTEIGAQEGWNADDCQQFSEAVISAFPDFKHKTMDIEIVQPRMPTNIHKMVYRMCHEGLRWMRLYLVSAEPGKKAQAGPFEIVCEMGQVEQHRLSCHRNPSEVVEADTELDAAMVHSLTIGFAKMEMNFVERPTRLDALRRGPKAIVLDQEPPESA